ncbi:MAG: hypothetical protein QGG23_03535, partial [Candidatus Bathyarchaeota archaeon]|nr:hypothetical protein [Candidatus Bathyarchaeota archaeon]
MPFISVLATTVVPDDTTVQVGDIIGISGAASSVPGSTVSAYWDLVTGGTVLNTTTVANDGTYEMDVLVPDTPAGTSYIWVSDTVDNAMSQAITVSPEIDLNIDSGIPGDDLIVTITGFFADQEDVNTTFWNATYTNPIVNNSETDANGGVAITFDVPDVNYGVYTINVTDGNNTSTHSFTIGAAITLTEDEGPEGYQVTITGRGFTADVEINETAVDGYVAWNSAVALAANIMNITDDDFTVDDDGAFTGTVVIPSAGEGKYPISVTDGTYTAYANFTIGNGGESTITVSPTHGVPGTTVTVTGVNFTQIEGSDITVSLATSSVTADVEADGTFSATLTVPSAVFTTYVVTAQDLVYGVSDTGTYKIGLMSMTLGTSSGDVGSGVVVSGVGFEASGKYNVTMGDTLVIHNGSIAANEFLSDTFYVPSMAAGSYTVTVTDATNSMSTSYEVTEDTSLSGSPIEVAIGQNLTLTGEGFLETDATAVTVMWANSTDSADVTGDVYTAD